MSVKFRLNSSDRKSNVNILQTKNANRIRGKTVDMYILIISRTSGKNHANYQVSHENKEKQPIQSAQMYIVQSNICNTDLQYMTSQRVMQENYGLGTFVVFCAIWYHWNNLKNVKNTLGGRLLLLKPTTLLKIALLHGCFSCFLNCTNGTKSRNVPHFITFIVRRTMKRLKTAQENAN